MRTYLIAFTVFAFTCLTPSIRPMLSTHSAAYAQEIDPLEEVQQFISDGQAKIKKAKSRSYRGRKRVKKRVGFYFEALKSFSSALRRLNEYQIEDDQIFEQLESSYLEVLSIKEVAKEVKKMNTNLMSAIKKGDTSQANKIAQNLIDIDERRESIKYLLAVLAETPSEL